jgi:hypothetical protein
MLIMIPISSAQPEFYDVLNTQYITDISELPYSPGNPAISWQQSGNIKGWIDITGFRNLSRDGEKYFILGDPASLAIYQYDAVGTQSGIFDSIDKTVSFSQDESNLIASLNVVLKWHTIACDKKGCFINGRFTDRVTFQDTEPLPEQFDNSLLLTLNVTEYNNSINPRTVLSVDTTNAFYVNYTYKNESIRNYLRITEVEQLKNGVYFANITASNIWSPGTETLHQMNNQVIIQNTSAPDYSQLKIEVSNLYGSGIIKNYSIVRDTYSIERTFNKLFVALTAVFMIIGAMIVSISRRI